MSTIADVTIPIETIPPGPALATTNTHIEVVKQIPLHSSDEGSKQYFRVRESADLDAFETAVHADHRVASLTAIDRTASQPLYHIEWTRPPPCPALYRDDLLIECMSASPAGWVSRVRANDHEALRALQGEVRDAGVHLNIGRLDQAADGPASDPYNLTPKQRAVLVTAIEEGYFSIPRETTVIEIAAKFDISDQAVSERLRRTLRNLTQATILAGR